MFTAFALYLTFVCATLAASFQNDVGQCVVDISDRVECGFVEAVEAACLQKGCCWDNQTEHNQLGVKCFHYGVRTAGYILQSLDEHSEGVSGILVLKNPFLSTNIYGSDIQTLRFSAFIEANEYAHFKITDAKSDRWEVPHSVVPRPKPCDYDGTVSTGSIISVGAGDGEVSFKEASYEYKYTSDPFSLRITRKSDGIELFRLDSDFIYKDQYIEFNALHPSDAVSFGVGETVKLEQALRKHHTYTLWAADVPALLKHANLYGSFPYYLHMFPESATSTGVLLLNSNGVEITPREKSINTRTIGGIIDMYVFVGPSPQDITRQYLGVVGKPNMVPFWSLGFQNCKWGYESIGEVEDVVANYSAAGIPLDTQYFDIDYMNMVS